MWVRDDRRGHYSLCERHRDADGRLQIRAIAYLGTHRTLDDAIVELESFIRQGEAEQVRLEAIRQRRGWDSTIPVTLDRHSAKLDRWKSRLQKLESVRKAIHDRSHSSDQPGAAKGPH